MFIKLHFPLDLGQKRKWKKRQTQKAKQKKNGKRVSQRESKKKALRRKTVTSLSATNSTENFSSVDALLYKTQFILCTHRINPFHSFSLGMSIKRRLLHTPTNPCTRYTLNQIYTLRRLFWFVCASQIWFNRMNASRFMCCARLSTLSIQFLFYRFSRSLVDVQNQKFHHTDKNVDEINIKNNQICLQQSTSKAGIQVNYERR